MPRPSCLPGGATRDRRHALRVEVGPQGRRADGGQPVGAAAVLALHCLDQPLRFQAGERLVERAGRQPDAGEGLDVLGQGIAVLGAVRQAGQDQRGRAGVAAETGERLARSGSGSLPAFLLGMGTIYIGNRSIGSRYVKSARSAGQVGAQEAGKSTVPIDLAGHSPGQPAAPNGPGLPGCLPWSGEAGRSWCRVAAGGLVGWRVSWVRSWPPGWSGVAPGLTVPPPPGRSGSLSRGAWPGAPDRVARSPALPRGDRSPSGGAPARAAASARPPSGRCKRGRRR